MEKEDWIVLWAAIVLIVLPVIGSVAFEAYSCHAKYSAYNHQWGIISGCQAEWNGKMTPVENIRLI